LLGPDFLAYIRREEQTLPRKQRRDPAALAGDAQHHTETNMAVLKAVDQTGGAICMEDATCWPWAGGDGIRLPAIRIPLASVDVWWVTGGQVLKAPSHGGSWFIGGLFPISGN